MKISQNFRYTIAALAGVLIAGPIAFWLGARIGVQEYQFADARYKASFLAHKLDLLRLQDSASLESTMQIELNHQLANHGLYLQSRWKWMWPEMETDSDREIRHAARYRIEHAFEEPDMSSPSNWKAGVDMASPLVLNVIEGQRQSRHLVAMVLDQYGK